MATHKQNKPKMAAALQAAGIPRRTFSIPEFCARNDLSEGFYRRMRAEGVGPHETRIFDRVLITLEAEDEWLRERAADTTDTEPAA
jgi:hypothetical protein